jgi:hypothetical protein
MESALAKKMMGMIVEFKVGVGGGGGEEAFLTSKDLRTYNIIVSAITN